MDKTDNFLCGMLIGVCFTGTIVLGLCQPAFKAETNQIMMLNKCELHLPRDQKCVLVAVAEKQNVP